MKLTLILFRRNRLPNGHIFRGKDRLVRRVEPKHLRKLEETFAIEEQNMFYLRHPYLTEIVAIITHNTTNLWTSMGVSAPLKLSAVFLSYGRCLYTAEESHGHAKALGKQEARQRKFEDLANRKFKEDVTLYERLQHLRVKEGWD